MSTAKTPDHQAPVPQTVYAERLEHIRAFNGVPNLKAFWKKIEDRFASDVSEATCSYASARYYHSDRDPPVDYLRQVSVVYDVPLEYLVSGEGPPSRLVAGEAQRRSLEERFDNPEIVGRTHVYPDYPDELKGKLRVFGAITEVTGGLMVPVVCQSVIADYLVDLVQREGLARLGWNGGIPERGDIDELERLVSDTVDRFFGPALRLRGELRPAEVVASVLAIAIPLYLRPRSTIECPACGNERSDDVHACPHCGESYPDLFVSSEPNTITED